MIMKRNLLHDNLDSECIAFCNRKEYVSMERKINTLGTRVNNVEKQIKKVIDTCATKSDIILLEQRLLPMAEKASNYDLIKKIIKSKTFVIIIAAFIISLILAGLGISNLFVNAENIKTIAGAMS